MRALIPILLVSATLGCVHPGNRSESVSALSLADVVVRACNLTVRAEPPVIEIGQTTRIIARMTNCGDSELRFTQPNSCGFAPRIDAEAPHTQNESRAARLCLMALRPYAIAPNATVEESIAFNGTVPYTDWQSSTRPTRDSPVAPGVYRISASAGMGAPSWDATSTLEVFPRPSNEGGPPNAYVG